ncbi:acyl-CoA dehydrogenase family protein [Gammaproteobacteria bacterium]|nr:acyl-CoA dehydrogenase family protein [Gammaproteobacteria bacterium]
MTYQVPMAHYKKVIEAMTKEGGDFDHALMLQILEAVAKFSETQLLDSNVDTAPTYDPKTRVVKVAGEYHQAYENLCQNGYAALALPQEYGGGGASWVLHHLVSEMLASGNLSLTTCPMLTSGALEALIANASEDLLKRYIEPLVQGQYSATMCLTEPQCGTDLGLIKTQAIAKGDHYEITGQKIWITFGEHDLVDNIIHLVLAKAPGAESGTKGISMFLVPKLLPEGSKNKLGCIGLEHKMGQHGSPTATMAFDGATGYLVGEEGRGMKMMFEMMNPARIGVGVQALGQAEIAYQTALAFAAQRRQSRAIDVKRQDKEQAADLILKHPDVCRMLMHVHATNVAMRWMVAYCSQAIDENKQAFVGLMTPIIKSYLTEQSVDNISTCMQVMGGMGYVTDGVCEKYYRDARITMIYEGTNGIQGLDLVGRKIAVDMGESLRALLKELKNMEASYGDPVVKDILMQDMSAANQYLLKQALKPENIAAAAPHYLKILAIAIQYSLLAQYDSDTDLVSFYAQYIVPEVKLYLQRMQLGADQLCDYSVFKNASTND